MLYLYPYKKGSESANLLREKLDVPFLEKNQEMNFHGFDTIINWGNSKEGIWYNQALYNGTRILNKPKHVKKAVNKILTLKELQKNDIPTIEFTEDKEIAKDWILNDSIVVCRRLTGSSQGRGIELAMDSDSVIDASLYTRFIPSKNEFRVHICFGQVIDYCQKIAENEEETNFLVKTHKNGWVYKRGVAIRSDLVRQTAINTIEALGLDFGAVDLILKNDKVYVIEVNSAPGIMGMSLEKYTEMFNKLKKE